MPSTEPSRFLPGRLVGRKRYRIVSLLGKGGMGEVYRADDLEMGFGERVALKFLPEGLQRDKERLRRLRQEIRIARKVTHPNVCRVHDLGWHGGALFLTMECIEGEDLARLLRRFGRDAEGNPTVPLPAHKALALAHQLCHGLAAIHDREILHRDLKPANVIVDDRGLAKITDFGLAAWVGDDLHAAEGTMPYMAPEQLDGREVTERSDLYALGLVLYELFTGRRAFLGRSRLELVPPTRVNRRLDPAIGAAIMHCLEDDPERRPASARAVAEELPEPAPDADEPTPFPSPAMLLVPDPADRLRPRTAGAVLGVLASGLVLVTWLAGWTHLPRFLDRASPPAVLAAKAREIASALGYGEPPADAVYGFLFERDRFAALERLGPALGRPGGTASGAISPITFWYRGSPASLTPYDRSLFRTYDDPPLRTPGSLGLHLDPAGRLRRLDALAPEPGAARSNGEPDWAGLIAATGLAPSDLDEVLPTLAPDRFADQRAAWEGTDPRLNGAGVRVEAAAHRGFPVSARVLGPESAESGVSPTPVGRVVRPLAKAVHGLWFAFVLAGAVCYTRRNIRRRCVDTGAVLLLAAYLIGSRMAVWLFGTRHRLASEAVETVWIHFAEAAFFGCFIWVLYTGLEPLLRRDWPGLTSSWVRLMHGRFRDPRVGRDVLFGTAAGVLFLLLGQLGLLIPAWFGGGVPAPDALTVVVLARTELLDLQLEALRGLPGALAATLYAHTETMLVSFFGIFGLFQLWFLVRRKWIAIAVVVVGKWILELTPEADFVVPMVIAAGLYSCFWVAVVVRLGVLPAVLATTVASALGTVPLTLDFNAWFAPAALAVLLPVLGLGVCGFFGSLGGRAVLPERIGGDSDSNPDQR